jgi:hypothetical protein
MEENNIDILVEITEKYIDSPEVFHQALAYHHISATLGQFFSIWDVPCGRPNVWFVLSCIPGRGRRSTIMNYNSILTNSTLVPYYKKIRECDGKEARNIIFKSMIEDGTPQGVCDSIMEGIIAGANSFMLCSGEFGDILSKITTDKKNNTSGFDTLLSRLYYGEPYKQSLSQRTKGPKESRYIPDGLFFTMLASMQEPNQYLNSKMSRQGLLRRMRIIYVKKFKDWKSPFKNKYSTYKKDLSDFTARYIYPKMLEYHDMRDKLRKQLNDNRIFLNVMLDSYSRNKIEGMSEKYDKLVAEDPSDYNIYQQTRWEHIVKYATLNAIAESNWIVKESVTAGFIDVKQKHLDRALEFDKVIDEHTMEMMENIIITERMKEDENLLQKIERYVRKAGPDGIRRSDLLNKLPGTRAKELCEYIDTLLEQEKITQDHSEAVKVGRPGIIYKHTVHQ